MPTIRANIDLDLGDLKQAIRDVHKTVDDIFDSAEKPKVWVVTVRHYEAETPDLFIGKDREEVLRHVFETVYPHEGRTVTFQEFQEEPGLFINDSLELSDFTNFCMEEKVL